MSKIIKYFSWVILLSMTSLANAEVGIPMNVYVQNNTTVPVSVTYAVSGVPVHDKIDVKFQPDAKKQHLIAIYLPKKNLSTYVSQVSFTRQGEEKPICTATFVVKVNCFWVTDLDCKIKQDWSSVKYEGRLCGKSKFDFNSKPASAIAIID